VRDAATLLGVIAGRDEMDATSAFAPVQDYTAAIEGELRGLRIGLPREYFNGLASATGDPIHAAVERSVSWAARCATSSSRTPLTRSPATTSSRRQRPRESRALRRRPLHGAFGGGADARRDVPALTREEGFGTEVNAVSCSGPTSLAPAITTRII